MSTRVITRRWYCAAAPVRARSYAFATKNGGEERLIELAKTCHGLPALEGMRRILAAAQAFATGASQHDDMTLVVLHVA